MGDQTAENALYFARDPLGRRSLLLQLPRDNMPFLVLSSTSAGQTITPDLEELSTAHIFRLDLTSVGEVRYLFSLTKTALDVSVELGNLG